MQGCASTGREKLVDRIDSTPSGRISSRGRDRATLNDVAAHARVSKSTVSLVIRGSTLVADSTRAQVLQSIREIGYVYNRGAATLRSPRTNVVALVVPQIDNPFFGEVTAGADDALDRAGFVSFLANTAETPARQDRFLDRMREHDIDGVIICPARGTSPELIRRLRNWGVPCVQAMRHVLAKEADFVAPDFRLAMELAIDHLVALGHRRIAFIGGAFPVSVTKERYAGFRLALRRHGLDERLIFPCPSNFGGGKASIRRVFDEPSPSTAAVCFNDIVAMGVTVGLAAMGRQAGTDFAVMGFDDIAEAALWSPSLTTIAIDPRKIGEEAAHLLIRRIEDPTGRPERVIFAPRLVVRESCGRGR
ncbi:MAG: LacI family DNA-binding transcriptional regulator [Rhodospirillales bacterium]|nr:LacI family DNA-binding transcriptional regulator [Rhodospirillales bacterium]